jgi:tRNA threonylcarbamoyl adenosine modification protein YeaZ
MRTLAIETATEACSLALFDGDRLVAHEHRVLGRGHAEYLVPMIAALPGRGRAEHILVSLGPGSFTGVRIGIATARALGFAWRAAVMGYPTLALVAQGALADRGAPSVGVAMTGGHGEWYVQRFGGDGRPLATHASLAPAAAADYASDETVTGDQAEALVAARGFGLARPGFPDARLAPRLPAELLTTDLSPIYGRPPDARLPR